MGSTPHRPGPRRSLRSKLMATAIVVAAPLLLSMPIALADCPVTDPECLTSTAGQVAGTVIASPTPDPGGTVDQAVQQAKDAADKPLLALGILAEWFSSICLDSVSMMRSLSALSSGRTMVRIDLL